MSTARSHATKPVVIFGNGEIAEVAEYYFRNDQNRPVACFVVDDEYANDSVFCNKPLVPWSELAQIAPTGGHEVFVAVGYSQVNRVRERIFQIVERAGYSLTSLVSSKAVIPDGFTMGKNCMVLEHNTVQPFTTIGHNTFLWSGNHIGHHVAIGSNVFISSHCVISGGVSVGDNTFFGVNASVGDHVRIGSHVVVGAGATVLENLQDGSVVIANRSRTASITSDQLPGF